ncbi:MAG: transketolase [Bacteroidetes bacterium]|nr:transketolase [Bacteroidota bacterium]
MRRIFAEKVKQIVTQDKNTIFLTGDIGFNALEEVKEIMQERFVNTGVAEQSMISVAAGMAHQGFQVFCYSIAPFVTYRCLEQIRNDVCFHNMPVYIVGNGGGYGYGIMGSSHHAIEDIAILSALPNIHCYVPSFKEDVDVCLKNIISEKKPAYLRLGLAKPNNFSNNSDEFFNKLTNCSNPKITVVACGPVANNLFESIQFAGLQNNTEVFNITKIPYSELTLEFLNSIDKTKKVLIIEEHTSIGGIGQQIAHDILSKGIKLDFFKTLYAKGYPTSEYGSQQFHLKQSGMDINNIADIITKQCKL